MESQERMLLQEFSGITKSSLEQFRRRVPKHEQSQYLAIVDGFVFGDMHRNLEDLLGNADPEENDWVRPAKRCVQATMARDVLQFCARSGELPKAKWMLGLSGRSPYQACIAWAATRLVSRVVLYERDSEVFRCAFGKKDDVSGKLGRPVEICLGDVYSLHQKPWLAGSFGVIDLDFCNNQIRTADDSRQMVDLVRFAAPTEGLVVLSTTLHVGRISNSKQQVLDGIDRAEGLLRQGGFRIRARMEYPYQSTLPMLTILWILDRRERAAIA